jgi:hypothetical protein
VGLTYSFCNNESTFRSGSANICKQMNAVVSETAPFPSFLLQAFYQDPYLTALALRAVENWQKLSDFFTTT